jgi:hypothetical protein
MNVPRTRPLIRYTSRRPNTKKKRPRSPDGNYTSGLHNNDFATLVGLIVTTLPQIEERMIEIMALLLGDKRAPARQIFRPLVSEDARVKVMRALLERSPINREKGKEFDEIIDLFVEVKNKRNAYAHGLWQTHSSGRCFLSEPSADEFPSFLEQREIKTKELEYVLKRMSDLLKLSLSIIHPEFFGRDGKLLPSHRKRLSQPSEANQ